MKATDTPAAPSGGMNVLRLLRWPLVVLVLAVLAFLALRHLAEQPGEIVGAAVSTAARTALEGIREFNTTRIEEKKEVFLRPFRMGTDAKFVAASLDVQETQILSNTKERWGINFGTTEVEYTEPATVYYGVDLSTARRITFEVDEATRRFVATFPPLEVVAVEPDRERASARVTVGWGRLRSQSGEDLLAQAEKSMVEYIRRLAAEPEYRTLIREPARARLTELVQMFLIYQDAWGEGGFQTIEVRFADEDPTRPRPRLTETGPPA